MPQLERAFLAYFAIRKGDQGWSEAWHLPYALIGDAYDAVKELALARSWLLPQGWQLEWASVRALAPPRLEWPAIDAPLPALPRWGPPNTPGVGLLMRFEEGEGQYGQHLFRPIADAEIVDHKWIRAPFLIDDGPHELGGDPNTVPAEDLFRHVFSVFRDRTCHGYEGLPDENGDTLWHLEPWVTVQFNRVSSRQVGSAYQRVSWEALDWGQSPGFSPCGTVTTVLRSCYAVDCQFFSGGPVQQIHYYYAKPGAAVLTEPSIFWGWARDKDIRNFDGPGERTGRGVRLYSLGISWGDAPGVAASGTVDQFLGLSASPWGDDSQTPAAYQVECDMPTPVPIKVDDLPNSTTVEDVIWITFDAATMKVEQLAERRAFISALIPGVHPDVPPLPPAYVEITSLAATDSRFPGRMGHYDVGSNTFQVEDNDCLVVYDELQLNRWYRADYVGHVAGKDVYKAVPAWSDAGEANAGNLPVMLWQKAACVVIGESAVPVFDVDNDSVRYWTQSTAADGDTFEQVFTSPPGPFTLVCEGFEGPDCGILEFRVDGQLVDVQDWARDGELQYTRKAVEIDVIAGRHTLRGTINGTTGGGYRYQLVSQWLQFCEEEATYEDQYHPDPSDSVPCEGCPDGLSRCLQVTLSGFVTATFSDPVSGDSGPRDSVVNGTWLLRDDDWVLNPGNTPFYCGRVKIWRFPDNSIQAYAVVHWIEDPNGSFWSLFISEVSEGGIGIGVANYRLDAETFECTSANTFPISSTNFSSAPATLTLTPAGCDEDPVVAQACHDCEAVPVHWVAPLGATAADPSCQALFDRNTLVTYDADCVWESISEQPLATMRCGDYWLSVYLLTPASPAKWRREVRATHVSSLETTTIAAHEVDAAGFDCLGCINLTRVLPVDNGFDALGIASNWLELIEICPGDGSVGDAPCPAFPCPSLFGSVCLAAMTFDEASGFSATDRDALNTKRLLTYAETSPDGVDYATLTDDASGCEFYLSESFSGGGSDFRWVLYRGVRPGGASYWRMLLIVDYTSSPFGYSDIWYWDTVTVDFTCQQDGSGSMELGITYPSGGGYPMSLAIDDPDCLAPPGFQQYCNDFSADLGLWEIADDEVATIGINNLQLYVDGSDPAHNNGGILYQQPQMPSSPQFSGTMYYAEQYGSINSWCQVVLWNTNTAEYHTFHLRRHVSTGDIDVGIDAEYKQLLPDLQDFFDWTCSYNRDTGDLTWQIDSNQTTYGPWVENIGAGKDFDKIVLKAYSTNAADDLRVWWDDICLDELGG